MEDSAYVFQTLLELEGATVSVATKARDGLVVLGNREIDLVISDLSMPDMDGFEFIRALRAIPALHDLPAIAASGLGRDKDVQAALAAGFSDHITKPVEIELLCAKIARLLPCQPG
nr:response regulator [Pseudoduganella chitinolytica]